MTVSSYIGYVPTPKGDRNEPALILLRGKNAVGIPLSMAHEFTDDRTAVRKAVEYAAILFDGVALKSEVYRIVDLITYHLVDLVSAPPAPPRWTAQSMNRRLERSQALITANGKPLVDAR